MPSSGYDPENISLLSESGPNLRRKKKSIPMVGHLKVRQKQNPAIA